MNDPALITQRPRVSRLRAALHAAVFVGTLVLIAAGTLALLALAGGRGGAGRGVR